MAVVIVLQYEDVHATSEKKPYPGLRYPAFPIHVLSIWFPDPQRHSLALGPPRLGALVMGIGMLLKRTQYWSSARAAVGVDSCAKRVDFGSNDGRSRRVTLAKQIFYVGIVQVQVLWNSQTSKAVLPCSLLLV